MYIFQFQADILKQVPIVLDMAEAITEHVSTARLMYEPVGRMPGQWDHWGDRHAIYDLSELSVSGQMYCRSGGQREPIERAARRLTGSKGWLIGYRFERCCCNQCPGGVCTCGNGFNHNYPPSWYATTARLARVNIGDKASGSYLDGIPGAEPQMVFTVERPWERITPDRWVYGDLKHPNLNTSVLHLGVDNENEAEIFDYRHWPMRLAVPPAHGHWWRRPLEWMEDFPWLYETCVGHWTAGGWMNAHIGSLVYRPDGTIQLQDDPGVQYIFNPGDWPALCRLAFSNFSWLLVRVLHNGVMQAEIELHQPVSSPQYLYIDTSTGEVSVRYCPVSSSPCVDLSELARFVPEASGATPAGVVLRGNLIGCIQPGLTRLEIIGFRMPAMPFAWSNDLTPLYS
jgi:hypothetical protein